MKKKKTVVIFSAVAAIALLFPIKTGFKDGGTVRYGAVLWSVTKQHSIAGPPIEETSGYDIGTRVRIRFNQGFPITT